MPRARFFGLTRRVKNYPTNEIAAFAHVSGAAEVAVKHNLGVLKHKTVLPSVTVCVFGICCIVPCVLLSPPSLYFLVFDRLSNDVVQVRHWWFGWGGIFIRTLPIFNGELILGSVASGLRAPGSLLRPMIKLKLIVKTIDYYHLF